MADPLYSHFLIVGTNFTDIPNGTNLVAGVGLDLVPGGSMQSTSISVTGSLASLVNPGAGFACFNAATGQFTANSFIPGTGISVVNGNGQGGATTSFSMIPNSTVQKVEVGTSVGASAGTFPYIKFAAGAGFGVTVVSENGGANALVTFGKSGGGTFGTVTSITLHSTTGLSFIGSTANPITTSGTFEINLPGSGDEGVVEQGDLLYGATGGGVYEALSLTGTEEGWVLTVSAGETGIEWRAPAGTNWYNTPNPAGDEGADVSMGAHAFTAVGALQLTEVASLTQPGSNLGTFWLDNTAENNPRFSNSVVDNQYVAYTNALPTGAPGQVLTWQGGTAYNWAPVGEALPSGLGQLINEDPCPIAPYEALAWLYVDSTMVPAFDQLTATSIVGAWPQGVLTTPSENPLAQIPADGKIITIVCLGGVTGNTNAGIMIVSNADAAQENETWVGWAVNKF